jgi:hypothetical protein
VLRKQSAIKPQSGFRKTGKPRIARRDPASAIMKRPPQAGKTTNGVRLEKPLRRFRIRRPPEKFSEFPRFARDFGCGLSLRSRPQTASTWSWRRDLNPRPPDYKSGALPTELRQHSGTSALTGHKYPLDPFKMSGTIYYVTIRQRLAQYDAWQCPSRSKNHAVDRVTDRRNRSKGLVRVVWCFARANRRRTTDQAERSFVARVLGTQLR